MTPGDERVLVAVVSVIKIALNRVNSAAKIAVRNALSQ